jgi:transposase
MTAGQCNEMTQADHLTQEFQQSCLIADKAYDKEALIKEVESQGNTVVIPPRKNRKHQRYYDLDIYKERHSIE